MSFNTFGFDFGDEDGRDLSERDFFDLSDKVGMDGKNNPQDVIKTEIILGNLGDLDLDRTDGPTSIWGQTQDQALRKFQERKFLKADGYIKPRGPTLHKMWTETDGLLDGFNAPTPTEVIKHHETMGGGQPILSLKHPAIKLKPIADLPALEDGAGFHAQRSADYLANIYDLGDWPRWTAKEIQDGGASAIATTRDVLDRLKQANPDQAAKVARAVIEHLPDELKTAFVGGPIPPALPRWVRSKEIMNRIVRLQAERDHGFDTGEDAEPKSMAEMEQQKPKDYIDIRTEEDAGRPIGLARPSDDPEEEERRIRIERLERRRAGRAKEDVNLSADASDAGGEADPPKDGGRDTGEDPGTLPGFETGAGDDRTSKPPEEKGPFLSEQQLAQLRDKEANGTGQQDSLQGSPQSPEAKPVAKDVTLEFDGKELRLIREGKVERTWPAVSGRPGFQNPADQDKKNKGPIPEGEWVVRQGQHQKISDLPLLERSKSAIGGGKWPGLEDSWGTQRVWLEPSAGTDTKGRSDFSIHGGRVPGSAGCIDLTRSMKEFGDHFLGMGQDIRLIVRYPKEGER